MGARALQVFGFGYQAGTLAVMGQILCCVSPGLPNEPELLEEDSGKSSRYRRGKKHRRKKDKSRRQKHRNHQPSNNDHGHVAQSPESRIEDSDDGRVGVATDATDRGTKTLTEIGFPDTEDEDEEATVNAEDVRIGRPASPTKFTHCENPGVACTLFRSYLAYHKDTLQVDAFGPLTPTSHGTEQVWFIGAYSNNNVHFRSSLVSEPPSLQCLHELAGLGVATVSESHG